MDSSHGASDLPTLVARTPEGGATFDYEELKAILRAGSTQFEIQTAGNIQAGAGSFPLLTAGIDSNDPLAPVVGFFGGIHGLERIGTQLILAYMRALLFRLAWDKLLHQQLQNVRRIADWLDESRKLSFL